MAGRVCLGLGRALGCIALLASGCTKPGACAPCAETPEAKTPEAKTRAEQAEPFWIKHTLEEVQHLHLEAYEHYGEGRYDEAFEGYRWLYEHVFEIHWLGYDGIMYSDAPNILALMAKKGHPQSRKYASELVDTIESEIRAGYPARTWLYVSLCRELEQTERVFDLYKELREKDAPRESSLEELGWWIRDAAFERGRYELYLRLPDISSREFEVETSGHFASGRSLVKKQIEYLHALMKVGRLEDARKGLHLLYCFDDSEQTKAAVASSLEGMALPDLPNDWKANCPDLSKNPHDEEEAPQ